MKKIILFAFIVMTICCSFISCAKLVSVDSIEVDAIIIKVDHDPMIYVGKTLYPADYDIDFEYDGVKGSWDVNKETYELYEDKVGETIKCYLITHIYSDGSTKVTLKAIEENKKD